MEISSLSSIRLCLNNPLWKNERMYRSFIFCLTKTKVPGVFKQLDKTLHNPHIRYRRSFPFLFSRLFFRFSLCFLNNLSSWKIRFRMKKRKQGEGNISSTKELLRGVKCQTKHHVKLPRKADD